MRPVRNEIGGLGNLMFKEAYLWAKMREQEIPDVYVQGLKYWEKYQEEIKQRFGTGIRPKSLPYVAVHIRRGDYLKAAQFHVNLWATDYYKNALKEFPDAHFLVFCRDNQGKDQDNADRDWCEEFMREQVGDRFTMQPDTGSETDDLNAMASCMDLVMANSTFSWWAAFLGLHDTVLCPETWFTDGFQRIELLPKWQLR